MDISGHNAILEIFESGFNPLFDSDMFFVGHISQRALVNSNFMIHVSNREIVEVTNDQGEVIGILASINCSIHRASSLQRNSSARNRINGNPQTARQTFVTEALSNTNAITITRCINANVNAMRIHMALAFGHTQTSRNPRMTENNSATANARNANMYQLSAEHVWRATNANPLTILPISSKARKNTSQDRVLHGKIIDIDGSQGLICAALGGASSNAYAHLQDYTADDIIRLVAKSEQPLTSWKPKLLKSQKVFHHTKGDDGIPSFRMFRVAETPMVDVIGQTLLEKTTERMTHFIGHERMIVGGKEIRVEPGTYHIVPAKRRFDSMNMFTYDQWLADLSEKVTFAEVSSKILALRSFGDGEAGGGDGPAKTGNFREPVSNESPGAKATRIRDSSRLL
jgi:hypothetical protein